MPQRQKKVHFLSNKNTAGLFSSPVPHNSSAGTVGIVFNIKYISVSQNSH